VRKEEGGKRNVRIAACGRLCVVDDDLAVIGSYNMDPRSNLWNSEIALVIYGEEFGRKVLAEMNEEFSSENAFRVGKLRGAREGRARRVSASGLPSALLDPPAPTCPDRPALARSVGRAQQVRYRALPRHSVSEVAA
jgi:phosphatidylserine/phosphatidylglycerophosphate/cardiolipin synthase-like enzyme